MDLTAVVGMTEQNPSCSDNSSYKESAADAIEDFTVLQFRNNP
jgi:hypothetical protein